MVKITLPDNATSQRNHPIFSTQRVSLHIAIPIQLSLHQFYLGSNTPHPIPAFFILLPSLRQKLQPAVSAFPLSTWFKACHFLLLID